jgi:threonine aldolase
MKQIDLRSDTVTKPTPGMRAAMAAAEVGDDVYGEDPTVNRLEAHAAAMLGKEAALFVPSGTQSNLLGVMSHCERGDEYIVGQQAHTYKYEGGGAAVLGSIQPQPLELEPDGTLDLERVAAAIKPDDSHFAVTRLLCLENTQGGKALPLDYFGRAHAFARERGLGLHLDGARVFNAAVKQRVPVREIAQHFDTVSVCLSKGLGAPVGSVLLCSAEQRERAWRLRHRLGGNMRQAGIIAAGGIHALDHHLERLAADHANAAAMARHLGAAGFDVAEPETNIVVVTVADAAASVAACRRHGVAIGALDRHRVRLVTHLDVTAEACQQAAEVLAACSAPG